MGCVPNNHRIIKTAMHSLTCGAHPTLHRRDPSGEAKSSSLPFSDRIHRTWHVREKEGLTVASALRELACGERDALTTTTKNSALAHHNKFA
jgi:hypothetical protein